MGFNQQGRSGIEFRRLKLVIWSGGMSEPDVRRGHGCPAADPDGEALNREARAGSCRSGTVGSCHDQLHHAHEHEVALVRTAENFLDGTCPDRASPGQFRLWRLSSILRKPPCFPA